MDIAKQSPEASIEALLADLAALGLGVVVGAGGGRVLDANAVFCELVGRDLDELRSLPHYGILLTIDERAAVAARRAERLEGDGPQRYRSVLLTKDDERVPIEAAVTTVVADGADIDIWVIRDLRPREHRDQIIARYVEMFEHMPIGVMIWDADGVSDPLDLRLVAANAAASDAVGLELASRIGESIVDTFPEAKNHDDAARLLALSGTGRAEYFGETTYGDDHVPQGVYRRMAVGLPDGTVAQFLENVTGERAEEMRRRGLLERLVDAGDEERRHLAMGVHDDPVQQLAAATVLVEAIRRRPEAANRDERLETIEAALRSAMSSLRRLVFELSPPELVESGLEAAIRSAAEYLFDDSDETVTVDVSLGREPAPPAQTVVFRIVAEALTNARKHARASTIKVSLRDTGNDVEVVVADDGSGFTPSAQPGHIGLRSMRERAASLGGECRITTGPTGTTVTAIVPVDSRLTVTMPADEDPLLPNASQVETLRQERDSLTIAAAEARLRAAKAEGRMREALALTKLLLRPAVPKSDVPTVAVERVGRAMADACALLMVSDDGTAVHRVAGWQRRTDDLPYVTAGLFVDGPVDGTHAATALRTGEAVLLDALALKRTAGDGPGISPQTAIVAPLRIEDDIFGVLVVARDGEGASFDAIDVDFLLCLADRVALAMRLKT